MMPAAFQILSNSDLLAAWERGASEDTVDRALTLLSACFPGEGREELAQLSIGERDTRLLHIYERLFGPSLEAFARCPGCDESLEYGLSTRELLASTESSVDRQPIHVEDGPFSLHLRLPDSLDLQAARACEEPAQAAKLLAECCIVDAAVEGHPVETVELTPEIMERISSALAVADPRAEMLIDLRCTECSHAWQVTLDIEPFLWSRIAATAKRLLRDVHAIASAYSWRESDILALNAVRRQAYVEMAWQTS